jgi:hypothetical protein
MAITKFSSKDTLETVLLTYDFSNLISDPTEFIATAVWSIEVLVGIDVSASTMLSGDTILSAYKTSRLLQGGVDKNIYLVHVLATTNKSQILRLTGSIEIEAQ